MGIAKSFDAKKIESKWYQFWNENKYFNSKPNDKLPYTIVIPPPNVTGNLHMGHGFQEAIMDALIRYKRMKGNDTLWQVGTDHAGIATQNVVEKQLAELGKSRHDLGRDAFVEKIWQWKNESGGAILDQMKRLGDSVD